MKDFKQKLTDESEAYMTMGDKTAFAIKHHVNPEIVIAVHSDESGRTFEWKRLPSSSSDAEVHEALQLAVRGTRDGRFLNAAMTDPCSLKGDERGNVTMYCPHGNIVGYLRKADAADFVKKGWAYVAAIDACVEYRGCVCGRSASNSVAF